MRATCRGDGDAFHGADGCIWCACSRPSRPSFPDQRPGWAGSRAQRRISREIGPGSKCWFAGESRVSRPPAARRRKLLTCALRGCRHRSRCSSASATGRGSSSTSLRVAAPQFRRSRGAVHATAQVLANVQLEVESSSTKGFRSRSGACCTFPSPSFPLTLVPRR